MQCVHMLHVYFHLKTFFNDNQVNDRLTLVVILKILILDIVADGGIWVSQTHLVTKHLFVSPQRVIKYNQMCAETWYA